MYICCHRAGKAKDLYSRSFLLDEKTLRKGERVAKRKAEQSKRKTERSCIGRARGGLSREWQKERKDDGDEKRKGGEEVERRNAEEDGRKGQERGSRRTGRINKRNAPPSHLRHLYFAAPHGRKSSSVSERGDTARRGPRRRVKRVAGSAAGKGSRPPSSRSRPTLVINPFPRTIRLR